MLDMVIVQPMQQGQLTIGFVNRILIRG